MRAYDPGKLRTGTRHTAGQTGDDLPSPVTSTVGRKQTNQDNINRIALIWLETVGLNFKAEDLRFHHHSKKGY